MASNDGLNKPNDRKNQSTDQIAQMLRRAAMDAGMLFDPDRPTWICRSIQMLLQREAPKIPLDRPQDTKKLEGLVDESTDLQLKTIARERLQAGDSVDDELLRASLGTKVKETCAALDIEQNSVNSLIERRVADEMHQRGEVESHSHHARAIFGNTPVTVWDAYHLANLASLPDDTYYETPTHVLELRYFTSPGSKKYFAGSSFLDARPIDSEWVEKIATILEETAAKFGNKVTYSEGPSSSLTPHDSRKSNVDPNSWKVHYNLLSFPSAIGSKIFNAFERPLNYWER